MIDRKPLIVVVHQNHGALEALEALLSENGYRVSTFITAFRAIDYVGRNRPDLVLAQEPRHKPQGIEFLESIKRISPTTEGVFLPSPLNLDASGHRLCQGQAEELLRIIDRLLGIMVIPERRYAPQTRPLVV